MKTIAHTLIAAAALTAALCTASARAEGFYGGGSLGSSRFKGDDVGAASTDRSATGLKLYGGYSLTPNFGVEAGYANLGKFRSAAGELKGNGLFVDAVGSLPLANNFSALARVGLFNGELNSTLVGNDRGTSYKLGAGVQYDFDKSLAVRAEWERYRFDALNGKPDTDLYSVGVNYRF